jgi:hypothetical protein
MNSEMSLIESASVGLARFLYSSLQQELEPVRLARVGYALLVSGCSIKGDFPGQLLGSYLVATQRHDGGWTDVEETAWCLAYLSAFRDRYKTQIANGVQWLGSVRLPCGAWGKSNRDQPRIPVTVLASSLLPDVVDGRALTWVSEQWEADLGSPTPLTYKGALHLLSTSHCQAQASGKLVERTIAYLEQQQNEDGGFGPWMGHPVGSCPWTTGVVLWGLSKVGSRVSSSTLSRAISWLESKQLPNGLWPYHYLDDATAMVLIGLSGILPSIIKQSQLCAE